MAAVGLGSWPDRHWHGHGRRRCWLLPHPLLFRREAAPLVCNLLHGALGALPLRLQEPLPRASLRRLRGPWCRRLPWEARTPGATR
eukprot:10267639-Heterocapsa_arctica.AAC.2